ncbi:MAG TPA: glycosyltransferase [Burkholderiales bacterium]|nr:glycosyltransferase [Burkholderiales bacterium]
MSDALRTLGHEPRMFQFSAIGEPSRPEIEDLVGELDRQKFDAIFDIACWGYGLTHVDLQAPDGRQEPMFDRFGVACAGMLFDHPYNQAINGIRSRRLIATYPDRDHSRVAQLAFPALQVKHATFTPPAIRTTNDYSEPAKQPNKPIDVLFIGNLETAALERFWKLRGNAFWSEAYDPAFCDALADTMLADPDRSLHSGVESTMKDLGGNHGNFDVTSQMRAVEGFLRYTYRHRVMSSLAGSGLSLCIAGKGWEVLDMPANVQRVKGTDYEGLFRLAAQAKICIDASTYLNGANDRVFSYGLNRAVCFTNASGYLREVFGAGQGVHFYSMNGLAELADRIKSMLAQPEGILEEAEQARQAIRSSHTWIHRVGDILSAVRTDIPQPAAHADQPDHRYLRK